MALLMARVDTYTIRLVGRWKSDIMLRYLHTSAQGFTCTFALNKDIVYGTIVVADQDERYIHHIRVIQQVPMAAAIDVALVAYL